MTSTEQKNVVQHFLNHCFTFGILPTIQCGAFSDYTLTTADKPFDDIGYTANLTERLRESDNPVAEARKIFPVLRGAGPVTRVAPFILELCRGKRVVYGNQAVMRLGEGILNCRWGLYVGKTGAFRQAEDHVGPVYSLFAPADYCRIGRAQNNVRKLYYSKVGARIRAAADAIEYLAKSARVGKHGQSIRSWCAENRRNYGYESHYRRDGIALEDYAAALRKPSTAVELPSELKQKYLRCSKASGFELEVYKYGSTTYIVLTRRHYLFRAQNEDTRPTVFAFTYRDFDDLRFLLQAGALVRLYHARKSTEGTSLERDKMYRRVADAMWSLYLDVMRYCGNHFHLRNKLGVYFDVLQWRYMAGRSGNEFYDHSRIMANKVESKGLSALPDQWHILNQLNKLPMDMAIDLLGMYKASIYPEVDPFRVVSDQYQLHMSRFQTDWEPGSLEAERFDLTRSYMWYFGIRVIKRKFKLWPGKIREGVEEKEWHARYKSRGIPSEYWREATDVDLTNCWPAMGISNEQYLRQQDSACAPPRPHEYASMERMAEAPRHHKRKLLYAVQEANLPDLAHCVDVLDNLGRSLPKCFVGRIQHELPFSVDIVTGSRCERHKDAPRPFYAASPPWGCILSYIDGITRDFLTCVPQCLLGKSNRQKFLDISTTAKMDQSLAQGFFMSDDKAKYSPRMDPKSQQLPADFFAELFNLPAIKACGPIMYHNDLYYRVCGHLVSYNSNGTDREGMRGASNTWLEIVAQGLATRICREKKLIVGKSHFLSFIDDGLRKFFVPCVNKTEEEIRSTARAVIDEVILGLRVLGRELSWDKTFVSRDLLVILNEIMYDESHFTSGLKSFCTIGDLDLKEVMSAADFEQLYFGKLRGALGVGTPIDLCHAIYIFEVLMSHYKMGLKLQDSKAVNKIEYRLFCVTPLALGGAGIRSKMQLGCTEVANATKEGMGNLYRFGVNHHLLKLATNAIIQQKPEVLDPIDFMREPEQMHVSGPRIRTQRLPAEIRKHLRNVANNELSRKYLDQDASGLEVLRRLGEIYMALPSVSAEEIRLIYSSSPVAFIDDFIQKLSSSTTVSMFLGNQALGLLRKLVRRDLKLAAEYFKWRCNSRPIVEFAMANYSVYAYSRYFLV